MRALRFHKARELAVEKVAEPGPPGPGEVLLQPALCGICGTDLHEYTDGPIVTPARPHPLTGSRVVLTVAHLDHVPEHSDPANLKAMCQRCHLAYDAAEHAANASHTRAVKATAGLTPLFDL